MSRIFLIPLCGLFFLSTLSLSAQAREVVAFWGFEDEYEFEETDTKLDFDGDVDNTVSDDANLQAFLGDAEELDDNGGGGFVSYLSPTSGINYLPTRTIRWKDLKISGGDDFDIGGTTNFLIDKNDGDGPLSDDFGDDALVYITLNGLGYQDFEIRFDAEGTPGDLPTSYDIFYRVGGSGTWFRETDQDEIPLNFVDYDPVDAGKMYADSGVQSLAAALDNQSQIEIIINDFKEEGNDEMELDNFEITANVVPEPASLMLLLVGGMLASSVRSKR